MNDIESIPEDQAKTGTNPGDSPGVARVHCTDSCRACADHGACAECAMPPISDGDLVHIFSDEHGYYWRENGCGYTSSTADAWVLPRAEAEKRTGHCGPEKRIKLVPAQPDPLDQRIAELEREVARLRAEAADWMRLYMDAIHQSAPLPFTITLAETPACLHSFEVTSAGTRCVRCGLVIPLPSSGVVCG